MIEVLLALAVIAIALSALLKSTAQGVAHTQRIKEKTISHWVAMQGIAAIQLGVIPSTPNQDLSQVTSMLGETWYWRATLSPTPIKKMQKMTLSVSKKQDGPFTDPLIAFRYFP